MEILSTGEKIKRARVYQGITLKELCEDKISISKMSCIENGKIKADEEIIKFVSEKLGVENDYLVQDVYEQILGNLKLIRENLVSEDEMDKVINHNLQYALEYDYDDLAFELIHRLFEFYVDNNKIENIQLIISQYYDLYQRNNNYENTLIYYKDMATFFESISEYHEAITYYSRIKELIQNDKEEKLCNYYFIAYKEGVCYERLGEYDKAYESLKESIKYIDRIDDEELKGSIYHLFAIINIMLNKVEADIYIKKAYEYQKGNPMLLAIAKGKNGECYFYVNEKEKAIQEIKEGIELFPTHNKRRYVKFINGCIKNLYENGEYSFAYDLTDTALNYAIDTDEVMLIEEAYYLKGMLLQKMNMHLQAEMYMNLSLDSLFKFGSKEKRYERYLDMASLYYELGEPKESLKYFTLAMKLDPNEKKI